MTSSATVKCPACGAQTSGKFCSECGATLGSRACPSCGAKLSARAKFCAECGTTIGGAARSPAAAASNADRLPWIVAGIAVVALVVTVVFMVNKRSPGASAGANAPFAGGNPNQATTDLSQMTPREAADKLFDRIMRSSEANDTGDVQRFGPMTLQAYANLGTLDADARLHVGLVQIALANPAGAAAQADSIQRTSRTHLFGWLLKARAAEAQGNAAAARQAFRGFLDNYTAERAKNLPEYEQHATVLTETRDTATRAMAASSRP
jgi:hypothetical protein